MLNKLKSDLAELQVDLDLTGIAVSDGRKLTAASAVHLQIDKQSGMCYVTCLGGYKGSYGENRGHSMLISFPGTQPFNFRTYEYATTGDITEDGDTLDGIPYETNCLIYNDNSGTPIVRCFFQCGAEHLYYRDFNTLTETFISKAKKVKYVNAQGEKEVVTGTAIQNIVKFYGGTWSDNDKMIFTNNIDTDTSTWDDGDYIYSVLTSELGNPCIIKSNDFFESFIVVGILPYTVNYECQMSKLNGTFYFLLRASKINFVTSDNLKYYTPLHTIPNSVPQRPQVITHNGSIYLFVPTDETFLDSYEVPVEYRRNGYSVFKGTGNDFSKYEKILRFKNRFGLVYLSSKFINNRLALCYSSNVLMLGNNIEGKSTALFTLVKNFYE